MGKEDIDRIVEDIKQQLADSPDSDVAIECLDAQALLECVESLQSQRTLSDPNLQAQQAAQDREARDPDKPPVKPIPHKPV